MPVSPVFIVRLEEMEKLLRQSLIDGRFEYLTPKRSRIMSSIRGKNNKTTERRLQMALVRKSIAGFTLQARYVVGKPDIYFEKERLAIFVDGCFWHGCKRCGHVPKSNTKFWALKIHRNKERDRLASKTLASSGTRVLRFWEHQLTEDLETCVAQVKQTLVSKPSWSFGRGSR